MAADKKLRESHFPAIEKRYGEKMKYWFGVMEKLKDKKYPEQVKHLKENYGFSQAHANALVMYSRGSKSSQRFETPTQYYKTIKPEQAKTVKKLFKLIQSKHSKLELVIAWNQPMLKLGNDYVFGVSCSTKKILIAPWSREVIKEFTPKMKELDVKLKTIGVPNDWEIDSKIILGLVKARLSELK